MTLKVVGSYWDNLYITEMVQKSQRCYDMCKQVHNCFQLFTPI